MRSIVNNDLITYNDIVERYGNDMAYSLLLTVERMAKIRDNIDLCNEEARFLRALEALNDVNDFAA